jgi:hypothetical protein
MLFVFVLPGNVLPVCQTYCGLGNYYEFKDNKGYFFVCGAFPWKLCCRSPGYTPYIWPVRVPQQPSQLLGVLRKVLSPASPAQTGT